MNTTHRHNTLCLICIFFILFATRYAAADDSLVVMDNGNVGIGTSYPTAKLHVNGSVLFNSGNNTVKIADMGNLQSFGGNGLGLRVGYNVYHVGGIGDKYFLPGHKASMLSVGQAGGKSGDFEFWTSDTVATTADESLVDWSAKMVVKSNGNVGIGTGTPESKLDVNGRITARGWLKSINGSVDGLLSPSAEDNRLYFGTLSNSQLLLGTNNVWSHLVIDTNGNVGIGTGTPEQKLDINGCVAMRANSLKGYLAPVEGDNKLYLVTQSNHQLSFGTNNVWNRMVMDTNGYVGIGTEDPQEKLDVAGLVRSNGSILTSDVRWKENIETIDDALDIISQLRGVAYDWIDPSRGEGRQIGVIAQEVEQVLPEVVHTDSQGYKSVEYAKLVAPLIEAVKILKTENEKLLLDIDNLKSENEVLFSENQSIKRVNQDVESRLSRIEKLLSEK